MTAIPSYSTHRAPVSLRSWRTSLLGEAGVIELLTLTERKPERLYDVSEGGVGMLTDAPLPAGTLVLAVLALPGEERTHDVIVRVAWSEEAAMGLEFLLPDDALVETIRRLRLDLDPAAREESLRPTDVAIATVGRCERLRKRPGSDD